MHGVPVVIRPSSSIMAPRLPDEPGGRRRDSLAFLWLFFPCGVSWSLVVWVRVVCCVQWVFLWVLSVVVAVVVAAVAVVVVVVKLFVVGIEPP